MAKEYPANIANENMFPTRPEYCGLKAYREQGFLERPDGSISSAHDESDGCVRSTLAAERRRGMGQMLGLTVRQGGS